jgi:hypothetical protein
MAGLIGAEGTLFSITFKDPDATTLGIMVGELFDFFSNKDMKRN